eukprot:1055323-Pelagomonas_calceolata.AAC.3
MFLRLWSVQGWTYCRLYWDNRSLLTVARSPSCSFLKSGTPSIDEVMQSGEEKVGEGKRTFLFQPIKVI